MCDLAETPDALVSAMALENPDNIKPLIWPTARTLQVLPGDLLDELRDMTVVPGNQDRRRSRRDSLSESGLLVFGIVMIDRNAQRCCQWTDGMHGPQARTWFCRI